MNCVEITLGKDVKHPYKSRYVSIRVLAPGCYETLCTNDEIEANDWVEGYDIYEVWKDDHLYAEKGIL